LFTVTLRISAVLFAVALGIGPVLLRVFTVLLSLYTVLFAITLGISAVLFAVALGIRPVLLCVFLVLLGLHLVLFAVTRHLFLLAGGICLLLSAVPRFFLCVIGRVAGLFRLFTSGLSLILTLVPGAFLRRARPDRWRDYRAFIIDDADVGTLWAALRGALAKSCRTA